MGFFDLFFGSSDNTTSFYQLYNKLKNWKSAGVFPYTYNLPKSISFPKDFWDKIIKIQKQTLKDGNERAMSIYWADGEIVVSPIDTGNNKSVQSRGNISVKYSPHPTREGYYRKEVILNSSVYKRTDVYHKKVPKEIEVSYLFNMHTHPQHKDDSGVGYYNFFSAQDIKSLIKSNVAITGLITDKLWILIRTNKTPNNLNHLTDRDITIENLNKLEIGVYSGEFYKKLTELPTTTTATSASTT
jgi:hypothetical protein